MSDYWQKLIVALDMEDKSKIKKAVKELLPQGVKFKIGVIAFTKFGPALVRDLVSAGADVFLDLKLYDIPNTMKRAAAAIVELGCWAFTVHIKAGEEALSAVKEEVTAAAKESPRRKPLIFGVTELTSSKAAKQKVLGLVSIADKAGLDGVIASAQEIKLIKKRYKIKVITPGIRSCRDDNADQKRVATAKFAFNHGADYIVVGRPIIKERDYLKAARRVLEE